MKKQRNKTKREIDKIQFIDPFASLQTDQIIECLNCQNGQRMTPIIKPYDATTGGGDPVSVYVCTACGLTLDPRTDPLKRGVKITTRKEEQRRMSNEPIAIFAKDPFKKQKRKIRPVDEADHDPREGVQILQRYTFFPKDRFMQNDLEAED